MVVVGNWNLNTSRARISHAGQFLRRNQRLPCSAGMYYGKEKFLMWGTQVLLLKGSEILTPVISFYSHAVAIQSIHAIDRGKSFQFLVWAQRWVSTTMASTIITFCSNRSSISIKYVFWSKPKSMIKDIRRAVCLRRNTREEQGWLLVAQRSSISREPIEPPLTNMLFSSSIWFRFNHYYQHFQGTENQ